MVNSCRTDLSRGKGLAQSDPDAACRFLLHGVLADHKNSIDCLDQLSRIESDTAVLDMIGLLDLPDGNWLGIEFRERLYKHLLERTSDVSSVRPKYDPGGGILSRTEAKLQWLAWFETSRNKANTRPTTMKNVK